MMVSAASQGYIGCRICGLLNGPRPPQPALRSCARCATPLHVRKPYSNTRTWALLITAYVLYLPANLLPVLETHRLGGRQTDTILGGAAQLWAEGAWPLALVIVVASVAVPLAKLLSLSWLLLQARRGAHSAAQRGTRLYRLLVVIGRWSMVDIYVGALLLALVQFQPLVTVAPGPAAVAFAAVVVLTIAASRSFDPRLLWDARGARDE